MELCLFQECISGMPKEPLTDKDEEKDFIYLRLDEPDNPDASNCRVVD